MAQIPNAADVAKLRKLVLSMGFEPFIRALIVVAEERRDDCGRARPGSRSAELWWMLAVKARAIAIDIMMIGRSAQDNDAKKGGKHGR